MKYNGVEAAIKLANDISACQGLDELVDSFSSLFQGFIDCDMGGVTFGGKGKVAGDRVVAWNPPNEKWLTLYNEYYHKKSPFLKKHAELIGNGSTVVRHTDLVPEENWHRHELVTDFFWPIGVHHELTQLLTSRGVSFGRLSLLRVRGAADFTADDIHRLKLIEPLISNIVYNR